MPKEKCKKHAVVHKNGGYPSCPLIDGQNVEKQCNHNGRVICNKDTCDGFSYPHNSHCIDCLIAIPSVPNTIHLSHNVTSGDPTYDWQIVEEPKQIEDWEVELNR